MSATKKLLILLFVFLLSSCGGGGGGGSTSSTSTTSPTTVSTNPLITSQAQNITTSNIFNYPSNNNTDYGTATFQFGKFGSASANCFIVQSIARDTAITGAGTNGSSPSVPNAVLPVVCQQSNGSFSEVSQQLFGQQLSVNGNYPLVADFNNDGIDDIFLINGFDGTYTASFEEALISNTNGTYSQHQYTITDPNNVPINPQQMVASDVNHDGCKDIVFTGQKVLLGDCHGNFTEHYMTSGSFNNYVYGTGVCAGDFNGSGHDQYLFIDDFSLENPPNNIVEIDPSTLQATAVHPLPVPYWNTVYNSNSATHSFACQVADINNDGKPDILIFTRPQASVTNNVWTSQSYVEVYLNQGNFNFTDISSTALPNYNKNTQGSYSARVIDVNGDGYLDLVLEGGTYSGQGTAGNQIWINNKNSTFTQVFNSELTAIYNNYMNQFGGSLANTEQSMLPIFLNGYFNYIVFGEDINKNFHIGVADSNYIFK